MNSPAISKHFPTRDNNESVNREPIQTKIDTGVAEDAHVVLLVNFVAPNLQPVCREIAKRVNRLTILSSVTVESNRQWNPDWGDLDVVVQKTWTITRHPKHPSGYRDVNYVHVPLDTIGQLRRLRPDAIVSLELGARTALSWAYRKLDKSCAHIAAVNASERSEAGRGKLRQLVRRQILPRVDWVTHNSPSCRRLLLSLGADSDALSPWNYAADPSKPYAGPLAEKDDRSNTSLLTVGELSDRKGMLPAIKQLSQWALANPGRSLHWHIVGAGPLADALREFALPANMSVFLHGFCDPEEIREHYQRCDATLFPTLSDEWGLVVDESLFSGVPVIGSCHAEAVSTLIRNGENGMLYDPEKEGSLAEALDQFMQLPNDVYLQMPSNARQTASDRTCEHSAAQFAEAVSMAITRRRS